MRLSDIKALILDFDGVFTTNSVFVDRFGGEFVECSRYDGYGLHCVKDLGIALLILSSEIVPIVNSRAKKLNIECIAPSNNKLQDATRWLAEKDIKMEDVAFIGNDINDIALMDRVGYAFCPKDAHKDVFEYAHKLETKGGKGVVRELCDKIKKEILINNGQ